MLRVTSRMGSILRRGAAYKTEYKNLVKLGMPLMFTQIGIVVVSFADTIMVAHCGTRELAASAFVNSIFMIGIVMQLGFAGGLTPLIGSLFSGSDKDDVGAMMKAGVIANVLVSLAFTAIFGVLYFFVDRMGQPAELLPLIRPYYLIVLSTLLPMAVFNAFQQTSNGCTDTATPMWFIIISNVMNIVGNWLLIGGEAGFPRLGLVGAGLSTLIARLFCMVGIVAAYLISRSRREYMRGWQSEDGEGFFRIARGYGRKVWNTSYPVMIQSGIECFMWSLGGVVSGWFGTVQLASYQVVNVIAQLGFMIYMGFGVAMSIRIANFTGVMDMNGVRRISTAGLHLILILATLSSAVFILFFHPLVSLFTPDAVVAAAAVPLLLPLILYQYGDAVQLTYSNALRGTQDVRPLLIVAIIAYLVVGAPCMLLLAVGMDFGNIGVYYSFSFALVTASVAYWLFFKRAVRNLEATKFNN